MLKDIFKGAVKSAATWAGSTIGSIFGPVGAAKGAEIGGGLADSLMSKRAGGGEFQLVDTRVTPPSSGGMMGFSSPGMARRGSARGMSSPVKTVDAETINAEWNYRLKRYLVDMRYFSRKS